MCQGKMKFDQNVNEYEHFIFYFQTSTMFSIREKKPMLNPAIVSEQMQVKYHIFYHCIKRCVAPYKQPCFIQLLMHRFCTLRIHILGCRKKLTYVFALEQAFSKPMNHSCFCAPL